MKREDFKIEGIPQGYRVYDVDLTPSGRPLAAVGHKQDETAPLFALLSDLKLTLPKNALRKLGNSLWPTFKLRCVSEGRFLFAQGSGYQMEGEEALNGWIWNEQGVLETRLYIGNGLNELLAGENGIVAVYDETEIYGDEGPHKEGIAVFGLDGEMRIGFRGGLREEVADGYAGCWGEGATAFAYYWDPGWALACIDVTSGKYQRWKVPRELGFARAISITGDRLRLGAFPSWRADTPGRLQRWIGRVMRVEDSQPILAEQIVEWRPGADEWDIVGEFGPIEPRNIRGLPGGRFIAVQPDGYTILSFE